MTDTESCLCRTIEEKQRQLHALQEVTDNGIENEAGLKRVIEAERRLRSDVDRLTQQSAARRKALTDDKDQNFRKLQQAQDQAGKVARKREELQTKVARLQSKSETVQVCAPAFEWERPSLLLKIHQNSGLYVPVALKVARKREVLQTKAARLQSKSETVQVCAHSPFFPPLSLLAWSVN